MATISRVNPLGSLSAEDDIKMLDRAFFETTDYRTLLESSERSVVVGRRGAGKSALFQKLSTFWSNDKKNYVICLQPLDDQIIGLRDDILKIVGGKYKLVKASAKILWKYALLMEIGSRLNQHYKRNSCIEDASVSMKIGEWERMSGDVVSKLRKIFAGCDFASKSNEGAVGVLSEQVGLNALQGAVEQSLNRSDLKFFILADKLDEGYEPDDVGTGVVCGMIHGALDLKKKNERIRCVVFVRDNIFRMISLKDEDYSKDIECIVLRMHWDEYQLFNFVCNRLRVAFNIAEEKSVKIWNKCVAKKLQSETGFKECLRHTLYRPRDLVSLLNEAFLEANRRSRPDISSEDIEKSAKSISQNRYDDLKKEYDAVFPGLNVILDCFRGMQPGLTWPCKFGPGESRILLEAGGKTNGQETVEGRGHYRRVARGGERRRERRRFVPQA